jgi:hypothetical protein
MDFFREIWMCVVEGRSFSRIEFRQDPNFYLYYELWNEGYTASISFFGDGDIDLYTNLEYNEQMKCHPGYKTTIKKYYPNDNAIDMISRFISKASTTLFDTPVDFKNYYRYVWNLGGKKNAVR